MRSVERVEARVPLAELLLCVMLGGSDMIVDEWLDDMVGLVFERIDESLV
jgi:hypothetical protein